jgi:glycosyltransferase involved in cell wall biosynthesis
MQKKNRSIGFFTPFPPIIGGGEKYMFTLLSLLSNKGYNIELLSPFDYSNLLKVSNDSLDLSDIKYTKTSSLFGFSPYPIKKYDYFFCLSNHIVPPCFGVGRKNILIIQFPFPYKNEHILNMIQIMFKEYRIKSYNEIVCYSEYSKKWIKIRLGNLSNKIDIKVINPPVSTDIFHSRMEQKEKYILSVGRFFEGDHNKKHLSLVRAFNDLIKNEHIKGWRYKIAGYLSKDEASQKYFLKVKNAIKNLPIDLYPNLSRTELIELYKSASIFWHGTGYDNDESLSPEKSEHFGIVIIEAMASGCVPFICRKGAATEIVDNEINGVIWNDIEDLKNKTEEHILKKDKLEYLSKNAYIKSLNYNTTNFNKKIIKLINV